MSKQAIDAVLEIKEELTDSEFRLLIILADSPEDNGIITPNWGAIISQSGFTETQIDRMICSLQMSRFIKTTSYLFGGVVGTNTGLHITGMNYEPPVRLMAKDSQPNRRGYIYLMHAVGTEWYKIGLSVNPDSRRNALAAKAPYKLDIMATFAVEDMYGSEAYWHEMFEPKRVNGEWFTLNCEDIDLFMEQ